MYRLLVCCLGLVTVLGQAETFRNPRLIPTPVDPDTLMAGDINGDGRPDIIYGSGAVANGILHPLLAQADGSYTAGVDIVLPLAISPACKLLDVDGDTRLDLVCPSYPSTQPAVAVLLGNGDGTFQTPLLTPLGQTAQPAILSIAALGDLNSDGHLDLVVTDAANGLLLPLLGDGTGHFTSAPAVSVSGAAALVTLADLNGDGYLDLLESNAGPGVTILAGVGDGTFKSTANYPLYTGVVLGDVDGDGRPDLITGSIGNLVILHGNADGTFAATPILSESFISGQFFGAGGASYLAPLAYTDLNGDGIADLVASSADGVSVMLGKPGATFAAPTAFPVAQNFGDEAYSLIFLEDYRIGLPGVDYQLLDLNGDGHLDFLSTAPTGLSILYGAADGTFASVPAYRSGRAMGYAVVADFNGDGIPDVLTSGDTSLYLSAGNGDGTFQTPSALSIAGVTNAFGPETEPEYELGAHILSGNFSGQGLQDILLYGNQTSPPYFWYMLKGHGDGTFDLPAPSSIVTSAFPDPVPDLIRVVDINQDGRDDIASLSYDGTTLYVYLSGPSGFQPPVATRLVNNFLVSVSLPVFADVNKDGKLDIIYNDGTFAYIAYGQGDGSFTLAQQLPIPAIPTAVLEQTGPMAVGDFDGDGIVDFAALIYWANASQFGIYDDKDPTELFVWYGKPDGTFTAPVGTATSSHAFLRLQAADLDQDGLSDLIFDDTAHGDRTVGGPVIGIMHGQANRLLSAESNLIAGVGLSSLLIADLNHDGLPDMLAADGSFGIPADTFTVLLNQGSGTSVQGDLSAAPEPSLAGQAYTLTASLSPQNGTVLTGSVAFTIDGSPAGTASLAGNAATLSIQTPTTVGVHMLSAKWPGDSNYAPVHLMATHSITAIPTSVSLVSSGSPAFAGTPVSFTATVTPSPSSAISLTGSILWSVNGTLVATTTVVSTPSGAASSTFTTALLPAGSSTVTAQYSGDPNFAPSQSTLTQIMTGTITSTTLHASPNPGYAGQSITLTATVSAAPRISAPFIPSGTVTFFDGIEPLGSAALDASGVATLATTSLTVGVHSLTASYAATTVFAGSVSPACSETIGTSSFTISLSPGTITLNSSQSGVAAIDLASIGLFAGPLSLTQGPAPVGLTSTIAPLVVNLTAGGTATATITLGTVTTAANEIPSHPGMRRVTFLPVVALLLLPLLARRSRLAKPLLLAAAAIFLQSLTGCGNTFYIDRSIAPGTYTIPITATDTQGNRQTANLTVIVPM